MKIAVIPARGGSKRIPRKNIKPFCGKPMIAWSIEAAKASGLFDHIIVSTDDIEIAEVANQWGAEVPYIRPPELSDDYAGTAPVIAHATHWALNHGMNVAAVCCIYATAPLISQSDLRQGWETLKTGGWDYAFAITDFASPIFRSFVQTADGGIEMLFPEYYSKRSQDIPIALHDAGQFYWGQTAAWLEGRPVFDRRSAPIFIPRSRVQDIDTEEDWLCAEMMLKALGAT